MAIFEAWIAPGKKRRSRLDNNKMNLAPNDNGNYNSRGELIGTCRSISALALESYLGRVPTRQDMETISLETATEIMRVDFWEALKLDLVNNQRIADFLGDIASSAGKGTAVRLMQKACNSLGENLSVDGVLGTLTRTAINTLDPAKLYVAFYDECAEFYRGTTSGFADAHARDLEKWYPRAGFDKQPNNKPALLANFNLKKLFIIPIFLFFLVAGLIIYKKSNFFSKKRKKNLAF